MAKSAPSAAPAVPLDPPVDADAAVDEVELLAASILRAERRLRLLEELAEIGMDYDPRPGPEDALRVAAPGTHARP